MKYNMRSTISLILILSSLCSAQSQNLILNGDFEQLTVDSVINWEPIAGTPDILNLNNLVKDYVWETNKRFFKGVKSRGFIGYAFDDVDSEVISTPIISPLIKDSIYAVRLTFLTGHRCLNGLNTITIGITKDKLRKSNKPGPYALNTVDLISDTEQIEGGKWHQLETTYKALGGERYLSLGNFNGANKKYAKSAEEIMVGEERSKSCNYLIIDKIELLHNTASPKREVISDKPLVTIEDVAFDFGKWEIKPSHFDELNRAISVIESQEGKFIITGYTDNVGTYESNLLLSKRRASAVKRYFVNKGMEENRFIVIGKGEASPRSDNSTEAGRTQNRRVEISIR